MTISIAYFELFLSNCQLYFFGIFHFPLRKHFQCYNEVKVIIKSTSIFGGSTDKRKTVSVEKDSKVIYINAVAIFGGITVK